MSTYKQHYNNRSKLQEEKNKREQRVPVQGRIDIKSLAQCAIYLEGQMVASATRSMLLANIVENFAKILENNNKCDPMPSAEIAYRELYKRGLGWEQGTKSHRRVLNVLEQESIDLETPVSDDFNFSPEEWKKIKEDAYRMGLKKQKDEENAGAIAPKLPPGMMVKLDEDGNVIKQDGDVDES